MYILLPQITADHVPKVCYQLYQSRNISSTQSMLFCLPEESIHCSSIPLRFHNHKKLGAAGSA